MPFGNGAGPAGMGPMTGRAAGFCADYGVPGYMNPIPGAGFRPYGGRGWFGRGHGRGFRNWYWATGLTGGQRAAMGLPGAHGFAGPVSPFQPSAEQELAALRDQVKFMEEGIKQAQERIQELEQRKDKK